MRTSFLYPFNFNGKMNHVISCHVENRNLILFSRIKEKVGFGVECLNSLLSLSWKQIHLFELGKWKPIFVNRLQRWSNIFSTIFNFIKVRPIRKRDRGLGGGGRSRIEIFCFFLQQQKSIPFQNFDVLPHRKKDVEEI